MLNNNENENDSAVTTYQDENSNNKLMNWMLEIRRFTKSDEACYECQLNTLKINKIHYCIRLKRKCLETRGGCQPLKDLTILF